MTGLPCYMGGRNPKRTQGWRIILTPPRTLRRRWPCAPATAVGAGVAYEFSGDETANFGNSVVASEFGGVAGELVARGQFRLSDSIAAFDDLRGRRGFGARDGASQRGVVGIRIDW